MMRTFILSSFSAVALVCTVGTWAGAQEAKPVQEDPKVATYKFLLGEANDRVAAQSAQIMALDGKVKEMEGKAKVAEPKTTDADTKK